MSNDCIKIFIENITSIDCAIYCEKNGIVGKTFIVNASIKGKKNKEGMLLDFKDAKKIIKDFFDNYFDHRLLIDKNIVATYQNKYLIDKNNFFFHGFKKNIALLEKMVIDNILEDKIFTLFENFLRKFFHNHVSKNLDVDFQIKLAAKNTREFDITYSHGLKQHLGNCQRFHGHSGAIYIEKDGKIVKSLSQKAKHYLDQKYIIGKSNLIKEDQDLNFKRFLKNKSHKKGWYKIFYEGTQGKIALALPKEKVIVLTEESTIENITCHIKSYLKLSDDYKVIAFEGAHKGAMTL